MTCTNWILTILAAVTFGIVVWPGCNCSASNLIVGIAMLLVVILAWTFVDCKPCRIEKKSRSTKKKVVRRKKKK